MNSYTPKFEDLENSKSNYTKQPENNEDSLASLAAMAQAEQLERISTAALVGFISGRKKNKLITYEGIRLYARWSVEAAKALINELNQQQ